MVVVGGLSAAGVSTTSVFRIGPSGRASLLGSLPSAVHDAATVPISGRVLLFGGGVSEGSNRIVRVLPGRPRLVGTLPQALSDLVAVPIGKLAYVMGGWNGGDTSRAIYAVRANGSLSKVGSFPVGVRYPAVGTLDGRVILAGGEMASGNPTAGVWSFDPATGRVSPLPDLPAPRDHTAGATLDGTLYVIGGLRRGELTDTILSWRPGQRRWHAAGRLPVAVSDLSAVAFDGGILALGGRGAAGTVASAVVLRPAF